MRSSSVITRFPGRTRQVPPAFLGVEMGRPRQRFPEGGAGRAADSKASMRLSRAGKSVFSETSCSTLARRSRSMLPTDGCGPGDGWFRCQR